jgi:hypothetical protein
MHREYGRQLCQPGDGECQRKEGLRPRVRIMFASRLGYRGFEHNPSTLDRTKSSRGARPAMLAGV